MFKKLVLFSLFLLFMLSASGAVSATNWTVGSNSTYQSIQAAIDSNNALENDTIIVNPKSDGSYSENLYINKGKLHLIANGSVTINASNYNLPVATIGYNGAGSTIQGFTLIGGTSGIVAYADDCQITGNNITIGSPKSDYSDGVNSGYTIDGGIAVEGSNVQVKWNKINGNRDNVKGIMIVASNCNVTENNITNAAFGILFGGADGCNVTNNIINGCYYGIDIECNDYYFISENCQITGNTIINNSMYGIRISGADGDENVINSIQITGNTIKNNGNSGEQTGGGIYLNHDTSNITISGNNVTGNWNGIDFSNILDGDSDFQSQGGNVVTGNKILGNSNDGIYITFGSPQILSNIITGNGRDGINFESGSGLVNFNVLANNTRFGLCLTNGTVAINATNNWWGTNTPVYVNGSVIPVNGTTIYENNESLLNYDPWLILSIDTTNSSIKEGNSSTVTVDLTHNSNDQDTSNQGNIPDETPIDFSYILGTVSTSNPSFSRGKARATITGGNTSGTANVIVTLTGYVFTTSITVDNTLPTVSVNPVGGTYNTVQKVVLTASENATVYYTTDGSDPLTSSTRYIYSGPININSPITLKFVAVDAANNWSPVYTQIYTVDAVAPTVGFNPAGGVYNTIQNVVLTASEAATVYYTIDGSDPLTSSTRHIYSGPINISSSTTLKFVAVDLVGNLSPVYTVIYTIDTVAPTVSANPAGGTYNTEQHVNLNASENATVYYTTDGSNPQTSSTRHVYSGPISISSPVILKFAAIDIANNWSPVYTQTYTVNVDTFTTDQIVNAANSVKNYIETNKALPSTVTIGGCTLSITQFLYLAARATVILSVDAGELVKVINFAPPSSTYEEASGTLCTVDYLDLAQRVTDFMDANQQAPRYGETDISKVGYNSMIYLYSRILSFFDTYGVYPAYITVKPWSSANIPIIDTVYTLDQIADASNRVKNYIETNEALPSTVRVGNSTLSIYRYLYLATQATASKASNGNVALTIGSFSSPSSNTEQLNSGTLSQAEYIDLAARIINYMDTNGAVPSYGQTNLGKVGYKSLIYLYSRILTYYYNYGVLPTSVAVKPWSSANIPIT
jgi:parallel beta-helix repeat protein